jgi:drug/metabolite transporter (DMT)-like permease
MGISTAYAAVAAALLAALCYAIGAALEQKEASATATERVVHPGLLWQVLQRPLWLAGFAVMAAGEVLHVFALAWAPLAVVQPIGVTTVLFALPIGALLAHRRPRLRELAAAAVTVAGLAALLTGMKVSTAEPVLSGHDLAMLAPAVAGGLAVLTLVALRASGALRTLLLGCGSGTAFGVTAALVRLLTHRVELHGASGLIGWVSPVIAVTAVAGLLLEQGAYKSGHLGVAVAGYTVTDPLVAVALGALVLHQPARASHPLWAAGEALVAMTGVVLLARATARPQPRPYPAATHQAGGYREEAERGRVRGRGGDGTGRERAETGPRVEAQVPRDADGGAGWFPGGDERLGQRKVLQTAVRGSG